jgi:glycosyltransferase involved in cell wall biosynthesis
MRILTVTLEVFGGLKKGGGERYATELTRALRGLGHTVEVAVVRSMRDFFEQDDLDRPPRPMSFRRFAAMVRASDVVHVHQLNAPGFDYAVLLARLFGKRLVLTDHGGGTLTLGRALGRIRLGLVDAAGFVSLWSRSDLDPKGVISSYRIIYGGGDHLPAAAPLPQRYNFGFVGRLVPHKGAHVAIEALPDGASLIVAGQQRDAVYYNKLQALSAGKAVTFIADASDELVAGLHQSVGNLLVPSVERYENHSYSRPELLGLVALEALAAGTPVIGSDVGGLGELLRSAGQVVVPAGDVAEWRNGLARALSEPAGNVEAVAFKWIAVAHKCVSIYDAVTASSGKTS